MGHLEAVEGRHRFIILIMVDDINTGDLPEEMRKHVKTHTYLEVKDMELFRKKLLFAMPHPSIKELNIERDDDYNPLVPLFNRVFTYRERMNQLEEHEV